MVFKETGVGDRGGDLTDNPEGLGCVFMGGWVWCMCVEVGVGCVYRNHTLVVLHKGLILFVSVIRQSIIKG